MKENLSNILEKVLRKNEEYIAEDGKILKAKVYNDTMNMDSNLIKLLINNNKIREVFFIDIEGVLVFDKQKFAWFIDSKDFLPDSYTSFKNKIGLVDKNRNYISNNNDVVLAFPFKDCVLQGGQDKEETKNRPEIMLHEIIASEDIRRMLSPKIFTKAKRYTKNCVEENIKFNKDDNLIIKGNNLIALSSILEIYGGKVKCIYIDPPYNTNSDSFNYNDKFIHSTWLTFMKNRLELAKKLLTDDGVIFVQCDDNEQAYLKVLMDNIFGRENFVATAPRKTGAGAAANSADYVLRKPYDFIMIYGKDKSSICFNKKNVGLKKYDFNDDYGDYMLGEFQASGSDSTREARPNLYYPIYADSNNNLYLKKSEKTIKTILPNKVKGKDGRWMWKPQKFELEKDKFLYFDGTKIYRKIYNDESKDQNKYQVEKAYFDESNYQNSSGTKELKELLGEGVFNNPKPEFLISKLLEISTKPNDLVLDFHLGSGTTTAVAHKMGRRYIGIEQMDYIESISLERMKKVIVGEQGGISKAFNWKGGGSFVYCELKENAQSLLTEIEEATTENICEIKEKIYSDERIIPYISTEKLKQYDEDFEELELEVKKGILVNIVDKNKLYVNYSDMEDEEYSVSEEDKIYTNSFYNQKQGDVK
ncbi:DNA methyltransferase [Fusobacterium hwasookii]|uniref:DNA methyltransferase n=1 Tax=Fusobacterium hwasookii TaxID=1583098 RepID=UPI001C6ED3AE|nr:site-specific DNA-methyltransferase [Fusobacterium hwasookii]QYR55258.1 site-specific DNA-methyltransferase [Fusobacterium hwasookii]